MFRKFRSSNNSADHHNYNQFRKKLGKKKKRRKRAYFRELIKSANTKKDFRKTWQVINKVLNKSSNRLVCPNTITVGTQKVQSSKLIANMLNKHFTTIGEKLAEKLNKSLANFQTFLGPKCGQSIFLQDITLDEIVDEIRSINDKKVMGFDNIPPKVIKWAPHLFGPILVSIFNKCIHLGYYPSKLKVARVVPIYKGGDINDINNYRPISVLTQFNRLFERVLSKRLLNFFEKHKIITSKQFGFLKQHSTEHAILDLKEFITESLDKRKLTAVLFLDLKKAFDTVSHSILLQKLKHYGVRGLPFDLLSSYLSGRQQY